MKKLQVFYYSATGTAKKLALDLAHELARESGHEPVDELPRELDRERNHEPGLASATGGLAGLTDLPGVADSPPPGTAPAALHPPGKLPQQERTAARPEPFAQTDLLRHPPQADLHFGPEDLLVITSPVYSGRLPEPMRRRLEKLSGAGTPVIIAMTYGDRAYDDALLELADLLEERGFVVIGAGAFIARHAVFPRYAVGRPDEADLALLRELARRSLGKLASVPAGSSVRGIIKGKRPYMKPQELPIYPRPDSRCVGCGACARICPVQAIDPAAIKARPAKHCLACAACIHACPQGSRKFRGLLYNGLDWLFLALSKVMKSQRKEPEIFV